MLSCWAGHLFGQYEQDGRRIDKANHIYIYIEKATASAADLWDPRNGCLDACLCGRLVADLAPIWVAFWMSWVACGVTWDGPCKLVGACGLDWLRQGVQMSYLAFLCRREHPFIQLGRRPGPESSAACGALLQPGQNLGRPVATSCIRVDPL